MINNVVLVGHTQTLRLQLTVILKIKTVNVKLISLIS